MNPEDFWANNLQLAVANQQVFLEARRQLALNRIDLHLDILDRMITLKRGSRR